MPFADRPVAVSAVEGTNALPAGPAIAIRVRAASVIVIYVEQLSGFKEVGRLNDSATGASVELRRKQSVSLLNGDSIPQAASANPAR